jgi:hypothetical protein
VAACPMVRAAGCIDDAVAEPTSHPTTEETSS